MKELSDKELLLIYQNENKSYAFNLLVRKYQQRLYWHIRKIVISHQDADDVLQNTFMKAWKGLDKFREESNLYTWLYKIATNESLTLLKQKKRKLQTSIDDDGNNILSHLESDIFYDGDEMQKLLQKAIISLPEKQRIVFNMKYYDNIKYDEMAEILETSVGALKASYHHAVKKIEKFLKND